MKKLILISLLLFAASSYSQQGWFTLNTSQGTSYYTGLKFFNSHTGYITNRFGDAHINGGGTIKTTNGGVNWFTVLSGVPLYGLSFIDINTGWVIGGYWDDAGRRSREVFRTTNAGVNFTRVYLDSISNQFQKIFFTDINTGYLLISFPVTLQKTTNSGFNWQLCTNLSFNSIYFINSFTGWGTAAAGIVYKTTNGGSNWTPYSVGSSTSLAGILFKDINTGWVNTSSMIFKSSNGGINWSSYSLGFTGAYAMEFYDYNHGWITKDSGKVAYTSNSGVNWIIQNSGVSHGLNLISFGTASTGYVTGIKYISPIPPTNEVIILKTTTGGLTPVVSVSTEVPKDFSLSQNYPNPFNPSTTIEFAIPITSNVFISLYDVSGRLVESLVNEILSPGRYKVSWDASKYSSGVYFYKIFAENYTETKKMVVLK